MNHAEQEPSPASDVGRLAGCLWLVMAGFGFVFMAGAAGIGVEAGFVLIPLVVVPLSVAVFVFAWGASLAGAIISMGAAIAYAGLGAWNYLRADDFEQAHPGADEISGGAVSLTFIVLALGIAAWSFATAVLARPRRQH